MGGRRGKTPDVSQPLRQSLGRTDHWTGRLRISMFAQASGQAEGGPLAGLTVLDLTLALAGPFATFLLAGLGARVIKIEHPTSPDPCRQNPPYLGEGGVTLGRHHPDDISVSALNRLRGKYGITLDLKQPQSR